MGTRAVGRRIGGAERPALGTGRARHASRWTAVAAVLLALSTFQLIDPAVGLTKDFALSGTVDCGVPSGARCPRGRTMGLWTDEMGGGMQRVTVDVSWIMDKLPTLDGDELVVFEVQDDRSDGVLQAIGVVSSGNDVRGTENPGRSDGHPVREQPKHDEKDRATPTPASATATPVPSGATATAQSATSTPSPTSGGAATPTPTATTTAPPGPVSAIGGFVRNATNGQPISGATVQVQGSGAATTDAAGRFDIADVPTGSHTLQTTATGFTTDTRTINVVEGQNPELSIALVPITNAAEIRLVLTWGSQPADVDAHLSGPTTEGGRFHISFLDREHPDVIPYVGLDVDDVSSFGPETITIRRNPATNQFVAGEYRYWLHNFSTTPELDVSGARVTINQGGAQLAEYVISGSPANPSQDIWHVVNLTVDAAGNITRTSIQQYKAGDHNTAL